MTAEWIVIGILWTVIVAAIGYGIGFYVADRAMMKALEARRADERGE